MIAYVEETDIERWERENRHDILNRLQGNEIVWSGDIIVSSTGRHYSSCVFLNFDGESFYCDIYETRPHVCRDFVPGSSELCPLYSKPPIKK
jgi:Fe-S-cluster containining protein